MSLLGSVDIRLLTAYLFGLIYFENTPFANFDDKTIFDKLAGWSSCLRKWVDDLRSIDRLLYEAEISKLD